MLDLVLIFAKRDPLRLKQKNNEQRERSGKSGLDKLTENLLVENNKFSRTSRFTKLNSAILTKSKLFGQIGYL